MKKFLFLSIILLSSAVGFSQKNPQEEMQIMMKMAALRSALLNKDSVAFSELLTDDATYGHSSGLIQTKAQLIRAVVSGEQAYKKIEPKDLKVRFYGNTAIVTGAAKVSLVMNKKPMELSQNILLTWVKVNNDWKLAARQSVSNQSVNNQ